MGLFRIFAVLPLFTAAIFVAANAQAEGTAVIWIVMNNNAYGTIAGLQKANYGLTLGTTFPHAASLEEQMPDYAAIARGYGCNGVRVTSAEDFRPALEHAIASGSPTVIDVAMVNNPTPTSGHWNILDIYSPEGSAGHVATD